MTAYHDNTTELVKRLRNRIRANPAGAGSLQEAAVLIEALLTEIKQESIYLDEHETALAKARLRINRVEREIKRLKAVNTALYEALRPFAGASDDDKSSGTRYRIWHISNLPNDGISQEVSSLAEAESLLNILAIYDLYLGDLIFSNCQLIEVLNDEGKWEVWERE